MSVRLIRAALMFFGVGAVLGALFVLVGPAAPMRFLGVVALAFALLGCVVELYALHAFAPDEYLALRERMRCLVQRPAIVPMTERA